MRSSGMFLDDIGSPLFVLLELLNDALLEKLRMFVIGHYDRDGWHGLFEDSLPHDGRPLSDVEE